MLSLPDRFCDKYRVTREGQIIGPRKTLKYCVDRGGYCRVPISIGHKSIMVSVHRLVAHFYLSNPDNLPEVNHKDGNKLNNHVDNLEWCTSKDNTEHAVRMGLHPLGNRVHTAKLNPQLVNEIRSIYVKMSREFGTVALANKYGVSPRTISSVVRGEFWV